MTIYDDIRKLKAESKYKEAWQLGHGELQKAPTNLYLKNSLFWVIYSALKKVIEPIKIRQNKTPTPKEIEAIDLWFTRIIMLDLPLPNDNIDYRLWNLIKGGKSFEGVGKFSNDCCKFIADNYHCLFSGLDYKPYITEKGESSSTVFRLARTVAANVLMYGIESVIPFDSAINLLDYSITRANDCEKNKIWLKYDKARIYLAFCELVKARATYLDVLKSKRSESWVWFGLAETFRDEPEKAISLLAHGLGCVKEPKYAIKGLISIANKLSDQGEYVMASKMLNWLLKIYRDHEWTPKDDVVEITANSWFDGSADTLDIDEQLKLMSKEAIEFTVNEPAYYIGVIERVHQSGKGCSVYVNDEFQIQVRRNMFDDKSFMKVGSYLKIMCDASSEETEVVKIDKVDPFESEHIRHYKGNIKIISAGIGFVDNIFIPPSLAVNATNDSEVTGIAIMSFDEKKQKNAWKAVTLK